MTKLEIHFVDDESGQCVQTLSVQRADMTADEIVADLNAHKPVGRTLELPVDGHVCAPTPPDPMQAKRERLQELQAKGWAKLNDGERTEAQGLRFDLGL